MRGPRDHRLGTLAWTFAVPLQELRAHVQRPDQDAHGASAQEREMARSRQSDDRGQEPGEDRRTLRRSPNDSLPLAASVSPRARFRQAPDAERDRRGGRDLHPRILHGPMVRPAAKGAEARRNGQTSRPSPGQYSRSRRPRPEGRDLRRRPAASKSTALRWEPRSPASSRRATISSATAAGRSPLSLARRGFPSTPRRRRGKPTAGSGAPAHQYRQRLQHSRLKQWLTRFNGVATKNLPNYLGWRPRPRSPRRSTGSHPTGSKALSETESTNT